MVSSQLSYSPFLELKFDADVDRVGMICVIIVCVICQVFLYRHAQPDPSVNVIVLAELHVLCTGCLCKQ